MKSFATVAIFSVVVVGFSPSIRQCVSNPLTSSLHKRAARISFSSRPPSEERRFASKSSLFSSETPPSPDGGMTPKPPRRSRPRDRIEGGSKSPLPPVDNFGRIGQTSAIPGATDFPLKIEETEEKYMRSASERERVVWENTDLGIEKLRAYDVNGAKECFDRVVGVKPEAYLWQRGICLYYLDDFEGAGRSFAENAAKFENRFSEQASEERIWRDACVLKLRTETKAEVRKYMRKPHDADGTDAPSAPFVPAIPENESLPRESRLMMRLVRDLFTATLAGDPSLAALIRARLHSICFGKSNVRNDVSMRKIHAWYYLGLHYDALGKSEQSRWCMSYAEGEFVEGSNDLTYSLPRIHIKQRNYKDGSYDVGALISEECEGDNDSILASSLRASVSDFSLKELQEALRNRGERYGGKKTELQYILVQRLITEATTPSILNSKF